MYQGDKLFWDWEVEIQGFYTLLSGSSPFLPGILLHNLLEVGCVSAILFVYYHDPTDNITDFNYSLNAIGET